MAPIRRYLRITKYSVLEVRVHLDQPALEDSWLLNPRKPVLPRVIEAIRPLVLPKLREENERERSRSKGKKKGVKDVVVEDDFEVSVFLTERSTRHSLLIKQKHFHDTDSKKPTKAGTSLDAAIEVDDGAGANVETHTPILQEDSGEDMATFRDIPVTEAAVVGEAAVQKRRPKRPRVAREDAEDDEDVDSLFVDDGAEQQEDETPRKRIGSPPVFGEEGREDNKKMVMDASYDGFAIYSRVLCLVIKRREKGKGRRERGVASGGQAKIEDWIVSTQMPTMSEEP